MEGGKRKRNGAAATVFWLPLRCQREKGRKTAVFPFRRRQQSHSSDMKKIHIVLLILVLGGLIGMSFFIKDLTTQETFATAGKKDGQFVVVKVQLDKSAPIAYDGLKDPNLTVFYAVDKEGNRSRVVYRNAKPTDMERSEGLDLNGYMRDGYFECTKLQMKCPSKYKDDMGAAQKNIAEGSNAEGSKY
jgi:cytochrome c-type biogenesis protein CcmE